MEVFEKRILFQKWIIFVDQKVLNFKHTEKVMLVAAVFLFVEIFPHCGKCSIFAKTVENCGDFYANLEICRHVHSDLEIS